MNKWARYLEWTINGLTVVVLVALAGVLLRKVVGTDGRIAPGQLPVIGSGGTLEVTSVPADARRWNLVLALSPDCPYCRASIPFYRKLTAIYDRGSLRTIALFAAPESVGMEFLSAQGVAVDFVRQTDLGAIGIRAVPTLVIADEHWRVVQSWTGKLSEAQEDQVLKRIAVRLGGASGAGSGSRNSTSNLLSLQQFVTLQRDGPSLAVIDTRERNWFAASHILGARNIPADELPQRATHEIPPGAHVVLFCDDGRPGSRRSAISGGRTLCGASMLLLQLSGFDNVQVLDASIDGVRNAGIEVAASSPVSLPPAPVRAEDRRT